MHMCVTVRTLRDGTVQRVQQGYHSADKTKDDADTSRRKEHETESPETVKEHHTSTDGRHVRLRQPQHRPVSHASIKLC